MKLVESKAEYIPQEEGLEGIYKMIELCGRTCYKSEDKITEGYAKGFVDRMIKSSHTAMLEHGTVYLKFEDLADNDVVRYIDNPYSAVGKELCVTSNLRVLQEHNWLDDLQYLCSPTEFHERRYTMRFTCSRAISHELVRSRTMSFAQESQRYINYSKERHGGEITYIIPSWLPEIGESRVNTMLEEINVREYIEDDKKSWVASCLLSACIDAERMYFEALENGATPQQARDVLPNATKTEIVVTGFANDWRHILDLRLFEKTGKVHPDMKDLMQKAQKAMQKAGIWEDIMSKPSKFD